MLRVSKLTDYATVVMTGLAEDPGAIHSAVGTTSGPCSANIRDSGAPSTSGVTT